MTSTNKLTNAKAFDIIDAIVTTVSSETVVDAIKTAGVETTPEDFRTKIAHMSAQAHKTRATGPKAPSKSARENRAYANELLTAWRKTPDAVYGTRDVVDTLAYVQTTQRAVAVLNVLLNDGTITRSKNDSGRVEYRLK